jgi:membrane protein YdbS with pleckstrin-like domain
MAYLRRLLGEGEEVVADLHPHPKALVAPAVLLIVLAGCASYAVAAMPAGRWHRPAQTAVMVVAMLLALAGSVLPYLRWRTTHFVLTDRRVVVRSGILARRGCDVPLHRVNDVTFGHGLVDRLLGCGTLTFSSAGGYGQLTIADVPRVESVHRLVYDLLEADDVRRTLSGSG